jgi:hypothetical protein
MPLAWRIFDGKRQANVGQSAFNGQPIDESTSDFDRLAAQFRLEVTWACLTFSTGFKMDRAVRRLETLAAAAVACRR